MDYSSDITLLKNLFLKSASIYTWQYSLELELQNCNCPMESILKNIFLLSPCYKYLKTHFHANRSPIFLFDELSFMWAAVPKLNESTIESIYLIGPVFGSITTHNFIIEKMDIHNMSIKSKKTLIDLIDQIPLIPTISLSHYVCMFYYALNNTPLQTSDIAFQLESATLQKQDSDNNLPAIHSAYYYESILMKDLEAGVYNTNFLSLISLVPTGKMSINDPIRQKKNEAISAITLFTRAVIRGGVPSESAYNLSDYYIQAVESADTITKIIQIVDTTYSDFAHRVQDSKKSPEYSTIIRDCKAYIDNHLTRTIDLDTLAHDLGYSKYYLTNRFKKETGLSLSNYIQSKRINYSKTMLENPYLDIQEISEHLLFSTPSYFTLVFKKETGITPTDYRRQFQNPSSD